MRWAALCFAIALGAACGDAAPQGGSYTIVNDVVEDTYTGPANGYTLKATFSPAVGESKTLELVHDLSAKAATVFAFGSTHIGPAVAFAMKETNYGVTGFVGTVIVEMNFGIVVASSTYKAQTDHADSYPFGCGPPLLKLTVHSHEYASTCGGAGQIAVESFTVSEGGLFSGTFSGRLVERIKSSDLCSECEATCQPCDGTASKYADVEGTFHFVLPTKADGGGG